MSWSKVKKGKYPMGWWFHKVLSEIGWALRYKPFVSGMYYYHLKKLCKYGYNLYGDKLKAS